MRRSPFGPTSVTSAPRATITGAVSEDESAQHLSLPGATKQIVPSFFIQKPIDARQNSVWL